VIARIDPAKAARRATTDKVFWAVCLLCAAVAVLTLAILLLSIVVQGYEHLLTRPPAVAELSSLKWEEVASHYEKERESVAKDLPEQDRAEVREAAAPIVAGLSRLGTIDLDPIIEDAGVEEIGDLEDVDWAEIAERSATSELAALVALDGGDWESVIRSQRSFDLGALAEFLTSPPSRDAESAGLMPALWGSVGICLVCALSALPLGVGTAVLMEEFKPKRGIPAKIHGFIELNIRNLAGVPSIVYGIIGLTVFVSFFNIVDKQWTFGLNWQVQFADVAGNYYTFDIDEPPRELTQDEIEAGATPPLELKPSDFLAEGERVTLEDGTEVTIRLLPAAEAYQTDEAGVIPSDVSVTAFSEQPWYYLQFPFGRGVLAGGLTLMLVVLPIVIISSQEAIRSVPNSLREGALALGCTRWQMVSLMTLPRSIPGIMTGAILAMSRAIGEAAPMLVIAGIVFIRFAPRNLVDDFTAMPLQIYNWASRPQEEFHAVAATGILLLLAVLLSFNALAVFIRQKFHQAH